MLSCLNILPNLVCLHLYQGTFFNVPLTSHNQLTRLVLSQATIEISANRGSSAFGKQGGGLQEVTINRSEMTGLWNGICACTGLTKLTCNDSV